MTAFSWEPRTIRSRSNPLLAGAVNEIRQDIDLLTIRVNYKFGGYGPVVAKY